MRILITGANGLVGKNLIEDMHFSKNKIIATASDTKKLAKFLNKNNLKDIEVRQLDVLEPRKCGILIKKIDVVVHLAAITDVPFSLEHPKKTIDVNYNGTVNVLESMRKNKVKRIVFPSTQAVYGNNINIKETDVKNKSPVDFYSLSKLMCEDTIRAYSSNCEINYVIFRASYLYGKHQNKGLLPLLLSRAMKSDVVNIGNNVKRDFLNVKDFTGAITMAMSFKKNNIFNIGTGASTSIKEIIGMIAENLHKKFTIVKNRSLVRDRKIERWDELANIQKLKKFGWKPKYDLRTWIKHNIPHS
ncbi:NAD(P)-dependent oxidoreductase [Candidatus Woesearchaeota archaeon]|nr:NAD(P)-dependent oxidoreductase [Candidatus Woesearchaeota archaeon]